MDRRQWLGTLGAISAGLPLAQAVAPPKSLDTIGRQWTDTGDDKPTKK